MTREKESELDSEEPTQSKPKRKQWRERKKNENGMEKEFELWREI